MDNSSLSFCYGGFDWSRIFSFLFWRSTSFLKSASLFISSPLPQVSFSYQNVSVVVVVVVVHFSSFIFFSRATGPVHQNLIQYIVRLSLGYSHLFKLKARPFSMGDNYEKVKIYWQNSIDLLLQKQRVNFNQTLNKLFLWVKGI